MSVLRLSKRQGPSAYSVVSLVASWPLEKLYLPAQRLVQLLRISHWSKNLLLLAPPFFGGKFIAPEALGSAVPAVLAFSLAASAGYIVNDVLDTARDRLHPLKKNRPLAAGWISVPVALTFSGVLFFAAMLLAAGASQWFWCYVLGYFAISFTYSLYLKRLFLLDVFAISACFIVRILAGGEAFGVEVSSWLFLTMFFISLFLASGKRLGELLVLGEEADSHRQNLRDYSPEFLNTVIWITAASSLITYALYTVEAHSGLFYTVPLATFGMLRYLFLVKAQKQGDPTDVLLGDGQLLVTLGLWAVIIGFLIYG